MRPRAGDAVLEAHAAGAVVDHLDHGGSPRADLLRDRADVLLGDVDDEVLHRLERLAAFLARDDGGLADLQLETVAPHPLDEDGELQLAAAGDSEGVGGVRLLDEDAHGAQSMPASWASRQGTLS
jgi:hypothetical protein